MRASLSVLIVRLVKRSTASILFLRWILACAIVRAYGLVYSTVTDPILPITPLPYPPEMLL